MGDIRDSLSLLPSENLAVTNYIGSKHVSLAHEIS